MNDFSLIDSQFIKDNEYIINQALGKYSWLSNYDDLLQEAKIWLCEAKLKFDPKRAKWPTYAKYYINQNYKTYVRVSKMAGRDPTAEGYSVVGLESILEETLYKNINYVNKIDDYILYDDALNCLKESRNKEILILITLGYTYNELSQRYNISRERIRQIYNRQLQIIRNKLCKDVV
jgi:RNA polymerase sigma factor (sigma-70 family)